MEHHQKWPRAQILHIATHGFFLENQKQDPNEDKLGAMGLMDISPEGSIGRLSAAHIENPLLRSGLALAGANTWLKDGTFPEDAEDAILTAEDVTAMDVNSGISPAIISGIHNTPSKPSIGYRCWMSTCAGPVVSCF